MKQGKLFTVLAAAVLGISAAGFPAAPEAPAGIVAEAADRQYITSGSFRFSYIPGNPNAMLEKYLGSSTSVSIPSSISTSNGQKTVTGIASYAFSTQVNHQQYPNPMNITSVSIPSAVTTIGDYAFYGAPLTSLNLPSSLANIGKCAFRDCEAITTLYIPASIKKIEDSAFENCYALRQLVIAGAARMADYVFYNCENLRIVQLHKDCFAGSNAFSRCTRLELLNNNIPWNKAAFLAGSAPVIYQYNNIPRILNHCFRKSCQVKFIDEYCSALCTYIVQTETRPWMSEAVKARVLYDWLINHCEYEDGYDEYGFSTEARSDADNQVASSVFLSYSLNTRGNGIGETVCEGYAKAYKMLLETAGIESYIVSSNAPANHAWNIVKVDGTYYQCDVTWDNDSSSGSQISYKHFLKTKERMNQLHGFTHNLPDGSNEHPLLVDNHHNGSYANQHCLYTFNDNNGDGLLDWDYDFDGSITSNDIAQYQYLQSVAPEVTHARWLYLCWLYN